MDEFPDLFLEKLEQAHYYDAGYIVSLCIFHSDSRPSLFIYPDVYRCAACGRWGKTEELVQKLDKTHFYPKQQEQSYSYNPFSKWLKDHSLYRILEISSMNIPISYLKHRGIDADIQRQLHIGLLDDWITFPILDDKNKLIGAVARAGEDNKSKSKYILPYKQNPDLLYVPSWDRVTAIDKVYLTFGILDAVTLYAAGFASMSTTTGKCITATAFDTIRKKVVIISDIGESKEAYKLAAKLGWRGKVLLMHYPDGCKDVNDTIWKLKWNLTQLKEIINAMG
jgi:DNA primase